MLDEAAHPRFGQQLRQLEQKRGRTEIVLSGASYAAINKANTQQQPSAWKRT
jgi:hypothetical protein